MTNLALLRVMILKEVRTTFRERAQIRGLIISVIAMVLAVGGGLYQVVHSSGRQQLPVVVSGHDEGAQPPQAEPDDSREMPLIRWVATAGPAFVGFFFSLGYLLSAVLASFVGEKEARTLEILLAAPIRDGKLFAIKCVSVLLPSAVLGGFFAAAGAFLAWALIPANVVRLPANLLLYGMVFSIPMLLLPQICFVGLGAAVSMRAETMKGAGQVLSALVVLPMFCIFYGVPMLLGMVPAVREWVEMVEQSWIQSGFAVQYVQVLILLLVPTVGLFILGRSMFRRDRMLT